MLFIFIFKMPPIQSPVTAQELEILSTKAISSKDVAFCAFPSLISL